MLLHSCNSTISKYLAIPEDKIPESKLTVRERQHQEELTRKKSAIDEVRQLYADGHSLERISHLTGHTDQTIKRYLAGNCSLCNGHYNNRIAGKLTPYENEVIELRSQGITYPKIHEIISAKGYTGRYEAAIKKYPVFGSLYDLLKEFHRIVFSQKSSELDTWIQTAAKLEISELDAYITGLKADIQAVKNGIDQTYNNGLAEGSVNKIKLTKRIMYGRNSFQLLRAKLLLKEFYYKIN